MKTWVPFLVCLSATACFHNVDGTKVKCTSSDHCPSSFICAGGKCVGGTGVPADGSPGVESGATVDAKTGVDTGEPHTDVAPLGTDVSAAALDASSDEIPSALDSADTVDVPQSGTGGTGGSGAGGSTGTGGIASLGGSGASAGGTLGGGGITASGGTVSSGGTLPTGGATSTGGITGTGGTGCQPTPRDCTSSLDNDCNGTPDKQETTFCACPVGQTRACQEHPGYDGTGVCKAGSQTCAASADKTTSSWGACTGAVAPGTEVCDVAGLDENCNGQSNEGCDCVNGASIPCDCGPATTCTNGKKGTCSVSKVTLYLDSDGDGYGDAARPALVCPGTAGYVSNGDDCDDSSSAFKPNVSVCSTVTERKWCPNTGGTSKTEPCDQGCINGACRSDGTIGVPGYVSCTPTHLPRCAASDGCDLINGTCGATGAAFMQCDGPGDCATGEICCVQPFRGGAQTVCSTGTCSNLTDQVCDPLANTCTCTSKDFNGYTFNTCS